MIDNEASQGEVYKPPQKYHETVSGLLDDMFKDSEQIPVEGYGMKTLRWYTPEATFFAYQPLISLSTGEPIYLQRLVVSGDEPSEVRIYMYRLATHGLQVANELFTPKEMEAIAADKVAGQVFAVGLWEGMRTGVYTPSATEYMDFLADLESFQQS